MTTTAPTQIQLPEPFLVMEDLVTIQASHAQTGGVFVMQVDVAPGGGPPPLHTHPAAELFYTLAGELTYFRSEDEHGNGLEVVTGGPGTSAFIPGGVAHTYRNFTDAPARYLAVLTPGRDMEEFLVAAGVRPGEPLRAPDEVLAIGERYGMVTLDIVPGPRG